MIVQHVLVPIDFSLYAEQALDYAIALAQKLQARVILLHVILPPLVVGADMGAWPSRLLLTSSKQPSRVIWRVTSHGSPPPGLKGRLP